MQKLLTALLASASAALILATTPNAAEAQSRIKDIVSVTQAMKNLSDIRCKLRDQERVIYGLDKDRPADTGLSRESIDVLKRMKAELDAD